VGHSGFGVTQSAFAVEQNMDLLAEALDIDPLELRRINAQRVGRDDRYGQLLRESVGLLDSLDKVEATMKADGPFRWAGVTAARRMAGASPAPTRIPGRRRRAR